jgi:hypothetical protein
MTWTAEEARHALDQLISRRKIRPADVERALRDRKREIQRLRERLKELESIGGAGRRRRAAPVRVLKVRRPRRKLSAKARSRLRLQGRYMGFVRRLTAAQKAEVGKVRKEKGWQAAIAAAKRIGTRRTRVRRSRKLAGGQVRSQEKASE